MNPAKIARDGAEAFDIDTLARRVHCSRATDYRYVGGKLEIRDAVLARAAHRIVDSVRDVVADLTGWNGSPRRPFPVTTDECPPAQSEWECSRYATIALVSPRRAASRSA